MLEVRTFPKPRTLVQWFSERQTLDLSPSYQRRGDLWPTRYKQLLINSILNCYDIPKIYVADFTYVDSKLNEGKKPYAVIDGKQRFATFFSFFSDDLQLDATPVYFDGKSISLLGQKYSQIKLSFPFLAQRFDEFVPTVMSVISDRLEDVQELFIRLNLSVSISGPERRNAMPGPLPELIRDLSVHEFFRKNATFPISRGQDLNAAAKFLLMESSGGFVGTKKKDLDRFVESAAKIARQQYEAFYSNARGVLDLMASTFKHQDPLLSRQAQITAYYWLIKHHGAKHQSTIHSFLTAFESMRKEALAAASARARGKSVAAPSDALIEYNRCVRSPDDKTKQEFLYTTLVEHLGKFRAV